MEGQSDQTMVVSGVGSAEVVPDGAWLEASVQVVDRNPATAHRQVGTVVDQVLAALDAVGVGEADRQTRTIALMPQMEFDGTNHVLSGYAAIHTLRLRVVGVVAIARVLEALVDTAGEALRLQHNAVTLASSLAAEARARAETAAVADARARAQRLAEATETTLGPILAVREGVVSNNHQHVMMQSFREESAGGAVQAGVDTVQASVQLTFALQ